MVAGGRRPACASTASWPARGVLGTRSQVQRLIDDGSFGSTAAPSRPGRSCGRADRRRRAAARRPLCTPRRQAIDARRAVRGRLAAGDQQAGRARRAPRPGHWQGTLVNALLHRWRRCRRPRPVAPRHRPPARQGHLGRPAGRQDARALAALGRQFRAARSTSSTWRWSGELPRRPRGSIDQPIGRHPVHRKRMAVRERGRAAVDPLRGARDASIVATRARSFPETGRTHQIRVHLAALGHPIVADSTVRARRAARRSAALSASALHAESIAVPPSARRAERSVQRSRAAAAPHRHSAAAPLPSCARRRANVCAEPRSLDNMVVVAAVSPRLHGTARDGHPGRPSRLLPRSKRANQREDGSDGRRDSSGETEPPALRPFTAEPERRRRIDGDGLDDAGGRPRPRTSAEGRRAARAGAGAQPEGPQGEEDQRAGADRARASASRAPRTCASRS